MICSPIKQSNLNISWEFANVAIKMLKSLIAALLLWIKDVSLLQVCVSSVDPAAFPAAVEAGALMVWPQTSYFDPEFQYLLLTAFLRECLEVRISQSI